MSRYVAIIVWVAAYSLGGWLMDAPFNRLLFGAGTMLWGCIITNWTFGKHNPTGLPYFNQDDAPDHKEIY